MTINTKSTMAAISATKRISTGIKGFDKLISGGFKPNSINLVAGGPGSGKTIFSIQFLMKGIESGEKVLYITFEEKRKKLFEDMQDFGWDLSKAEKEGKFTILEYTPEKVKKMLAEGGGVLESMIEKSKVKRIVIDSITSFALLYRDELTKKEAALALFEMINKWGCTAVLTAQEEAIESDTVSAALEFEVDSIIIIYHSKIDGERIRGIEILKMRGTKHPSKTFRFEILDKKGMCVYSDKIIELNK
ncbi:hypothetical protein J4403_01675 [Candidatus Woesearchaeota archaeon]|nr:hypothetical protein [Candidatus Woesearchaeota archaeon]